MSDALKILLVDDDADDLFFLHNALKNSEMNAVVKEAASFAEGMNALKNENFDCLVLDYRLQDGNGLELFKSAMNLKQPHPPVVFVSNVNNEQIAVEVIKSGAADYLPKGKISPDAIADSIAKAVQFHRLEMRAKQAEQKLRENEKFYRTIVETVSEIIFRIDPDRNIVFANSSFRFLGYDAADLVGKPLEMFIESKNQKKVLSRIATSGVGPLATIGLKVGFKVNPDSCLFEEMKTADFIVDAFGLWDVPDEFVLKKDIEKKFLGTLCIGRMCPCFNNSCVKIQ